MQYRKLIFHYTMLFCREVTRGYPYKIILQNIQYLLFYFYTHGVLSLDGMEAGALCVLAILSLFVFTSFAQYENRSATEVCINRS